MSRAAFTFGEYLDNVASPGEAINPVFEQRLVGLISTLDRIAAILESNRIAYQVIGGLAVALHVESSDPKLTSLTRDVDLLVERSDRAAIQEICEQHGFLYQRAATGDTLAFDGGLSSRNSIHLIFSGEKVRADYWEAAPPINPVRMRVCGIEVHVIPVAGLLRMKLTSFPLKDKVHVKAMDAAGLITREIEDGLTDRFASRLREIRETE